MGNNFKNGVVYFVVSIISQIINLFFVPLYTKNLSTIEVGRYNLAMSVQVLLSILIVFGIGSSFVRFYDDVDNKKHLKSTTILFIIIMTIISFIILKLGAEQVGNLIFKDNEGIKYMYYILISSSLIAILGVITSALRMEFKAKESSFIILSEMIIRISIAIVFILVLKRGALSLIEAQIFSNFIVLFIILLKNIRSISFRFEKKYFKIMFNYGVGLVFGDISMWVLNLIDRYFLSAINGLTEVAIYSTACKIGMLINPVFIEPFRQLYTPIKFRIYKEKNGLKVINDYFKLYCAIGWFCVLGLGIGSNIMIKILATKEYYSGINIVPIIAFSYFLWGLVQFYSLGLLINKKTMTNSIIANSSAVINMALNIILIPKISGYGAALSTCIAYIIANYLYNYFGNKEFNSKIKILSSYKLLLIVVPLYLVYRFILILNSNLFIEIITIVLIVLIYWYIIIKIKFLPIEFVDKLKAKIYRCVTLGKIYIYKLENFKEVQDFNDNYIFEKMNKFHLGFISERYKNEIDYCKIKDLNEKINDNLTDIFILKNKNNNDICGFGSIGYEKIWVSGLKDYINLEINNQAYFYDDYVFNDYRGNGIQKILIINRLKYIKNKNYEEALVVIRDIIKASKINYSKLGFKPIKYFIRLNFRRR